MEPDAYPELDPLARAAGIGQYGRLCNLLRRSDANINLCSGRNLRTPLHVAASQGHHSIVSHLLLKGADIEARCGRLGETALHIAVGVGHKAIAKLLLQRGANPNARTGDTGQTSLHIASMHGYTEIAKLLLDQGVDVNESATDMDWAPLHYAAYHGHTRIVHLLLSNGANVQIRSSKWNDTPLHLATSKGHAQVVRALIDKGAAVHAMGGKLGRTAVHQAAFMGQTEVLRVLASAGADLESQDFHKRTVLTLAALYGKTEVARLLIEEFGLKIDSIDGQGCTALGCAAEKDRTYCVRQLLALGASTEHGQGKGRPIRPLCRAVARGSESMVCLLLDHDADVNAVDSLGFAPLHVAAKEGKQEIVRELVLRGAALGAKTRQGATPFMLAKQKGFDHLLPLLDESAGLRAVGDGSRLFLSAVENGRLSEARRWIAKGIDINPIDSSRTSALLLAAKRGPSGLPTVKLLIQLKSRVNDTDSAGHSPIWWTAWHGYRETATSLLAEGANVGLADALGWTPLFAAAAMGHDDMVALLAEKGSIIDLTDTEGWTALDYAAFRGHVSVVRLLLKKAVDSRCAPLQLDRALEFAKDNEDEELVDILTAAVSKLSFRRAKAKLKQTLWSGLKGKVSGLKKKSTGSSSRSGDDRQQSQMDSVTGSIGRLSRGASTRKDEASDDESEADGETEDSQSIDSVEERDTRLHSAAETGDIAWASRLLRTGVEIESLSNGSKSTPLIKATLGGHISMVRLLLSKGASLEGHDADGWTALHVACSSQTDTAPSLVRLLLEAGADIEARASDDRTPLIVAAQNNKEAVKVLLEYGAVVEAADDEGSTALWHAAGMGEVSTVCLLLEKGADINTRGGWGFTPLMNAASTGSSTAARVLLGKSPDLDVTTTDKDEETALHIAARNGHDGVVRELINAGADINHRDGRGETPLLVASRLGCSMTARLLVEGGARLDIPDEKRRPPLYFAQRGGYSDIVDILSGYANHLYSPLAGETSGVRQYVYKPLVKKTGTRLLGLHPGFPDDILSFDLIEVDLEEQPRYEALSYEWGETTGSIPVLCCGRYLDITPNLWNALTKLRLRDNKRVLWVDAVCINQRDNSEKNQQLPLMARIYGGATSVLMWLGDETDETKTAFALLRAMSRVHSELEQSRESGKSPEKEAKAARCKLTEATWRDVAHETAREPLEVALCLEDVFGRGYFERAWIKQELFLAPQGTIMAGPEEISWALFQKAVRALFASLSLKGVISEDLEDAIEEVKVMLTKYGAIIQSTSHCKRFERSRHISVSAGYELMVFAKASNPRDKVFALLGLLKESDRDALAADYNLPVEQVYTSAARQVVQQDRTLALWRLCHHRPGQNTTPNLPSWVPDWAVSRTMHFSDPNWERLVVAHCGSRCPVGNLFKTNVRTVGSSLRVRGCIIDRVDAIILADAFLDFYGVVKEAAKILAARGISIFDKYSAHVPAMSQHTLSPEPTYLEIILRISLLNKYHKDDALAFWTVSKELTEAVCFFAWKLSTDPENPGGTRRLPLDLGVDVGYWFDRAREDPEYDFDIFGWMEPHFVKGYSLVFLEKGGVGGAIDLNDTAEDVVVAVLGGAEDFCLLRKREKDSGALFYNYLGMVKLAHFVGLTPETIDDIQEGAKANLREIEIS